ncbi:MAG: AAA family ATPase [Lachnospiraceae bacterium]|nr:AAA family ATPase [Lachnospiraceae bacterium]
MKQGKTIALVNQKGGVGKTTTTINLGACLAEQGKKVLLVDLDSQGNLTYCCGNKDKDLDAIPNTMAELIEAKIRQKEYNIRDYIKSYENMSYIACNVLMADVEMLLITAMEREFMLKEILEPLKKEFDYIILDCGPTLGIFMLNALVAADSVMIPSETETFSAVGLEQLIKSVLRTRKRLNPNLDIDGILFTKVTESFQIAKKYMQQIYDKYGEFIPIYDFVIPRLTEVSKAIDENRPLIDYKDERIKEGESTVAKMYRKLAREVIAGEGMENE